MNFLLFCRILTFNTDSKKYIQYISIIIYKMTKDKYQIKLKFMKCHKLYKYMC